MADKSKAEKFKRRKITTNAQAKVRQLFPKIAKERKIFFRSEHEFYKQPTKEKKKNQPTISNQ